MTDFSALSRKYPNHEFVVSRIMDEFGYRYLISSKDQPKERVLEFAEDCLGPGFLSHIHCVDGTWTYRVME